MGFIDMLYALTDRISGRSDGGYDNRNDEYDEYADDAEYGDDDQAAYDAPPEREQSDYETSYGSAGGYAAAGARPAKPRSRAKPSLADRLRGDPQRGDPQRGDPQREPARQSSRKTYGGQPARSPRDNVIPIRQAQDSAYGYDAYEEEEEVSSPPPKAQPVQHQTMIFLVRTLEDSEKIIAHMLSGGKVIVNMEEIDEGLKRRILDMISGAAYALESSVKRISMRNYYIAPFGEEIVSNVGSREQEQETDRGDGGYSGLRAAPPRSRRY